MKQFYLLACVAGTVLPYIPFGMWLADNGIDPALFLEEIVEHRIGLFAWLDVLVSAVVLLQFVSVEGPRTGIQHSWVVTVGTLAVGVSLGLPLFLYLREQRLAEQSTAPA